MIVFTTSDIVQHFFWPIHAPVIPGEPIASVYRRLDEALGEILSLIDAQTNVLLISDHGAGQYLPVSGLVNEFLSKLGFLHFKEKTKWSTSAVRRLYRFASTKIPQRMRSLLRRRFTGVHGKLFSDLHYQDIDWEMTQAFSPAGRDEIRINLRGKEPQGIVEPGAEYETLLERITKSFLNCYDPITGDSIVEAIRYRDEIYHGSFLQSASDLTIEWNYDSRATGLAYESKDKAFTLTEHLQEDMMTITGDHRPMGILIAAGPAIKQGGALEGAHLADIAPTCTYLLGEKVPSGLDGTVITSLVDESYHKNNPIQYSRETLKEEMHPARSYSKKEEEIIKQRLKDLGYLD